MKRLFIFIFIMFLFAVNTYADIVWRNISSRINAGRFNCVAIDPRNHAIVYVGTEEGLYKTENKGLSWKRVYSGLGGKGDINSIYLKEKEIFLATKRGLFVSNDSGRRWQPILGKVSKLSIFSVAVTKNREPRIFIATDAGFFKSINNRVTTWKRIYLDKIKDDNMSGEDDTEGDSRRLTKVLSLATSYEDSKRLYVGTDDGIFISYDNGERFTRFTDEGLPDRRILFLTESFDKPFILYVVTKRGVYYYSKDGWHKWELDQFVDEVTTIAFGLESKRSIWVTTKRALYKTVNVETDEDKAEFEAANILENFSKEPSINEVQKVAIRYAEVHPDKIVKWRRKACAKALLPQVRFGLDRSESDTYEIYTSSSKQYSVKGPKKNSNGWNITFVWDLGDLIWNKDQTLIDVRSKLMVQLRDDILDEVTSYYFERRRLIVELLREPPKDTSLRLRKELRIQELTANIDALTGGYFTRRLKTQTEKKMH